MKSDAAVGRNSMGILVADSNQTQSQLLSSALRRQHHMRVGSCPNELAQCLAALRLMMVDIVILAGDTSEQDRVIETIRGIHSAHPKVGIVLSSDRYDRHLVVDATRAGARGLFCRASEPFRALCRCIAVVHQGQFWANTEHIGYIVEALSSNLSPRFRNVKSEHPLTEREAQLVGFVAEGLGNRNIAELLGIKANTVKKALLRIYDKLGVSNRVELVLYALTHQACAASTAQPPSLPLGSVPSVNATTLSGGNARKTNGRSMPMASQPPAKVLLVEDNSHK